MTYNFGNAFTPRPAAGTTTATATATAAVWPTTAFTVDTVVQVTATTASWLRAAHSAATAANTDMVLAANAPVLIRLPAGCKLAVVAQATAGTVTFIPVD